MQDYPNLRDTKVFVADAYSVDGTPDLALAFRDRLNISVIPGGLPSVGRNAGALRATSKFVLFIDADIEIGDPTLLRRSIEQMKKRKLFCLTTNIQCIRGGTFDHVLYAANNIVQRITSWTRPFATGMYMMLIEKRSGTWVDSMRKHSMPKITC
jgi:glycosyltransferase involved in cell wall biosynthesis